MFSSTAELLGVVWSGFEALALAIFAFGLLQLKQRAEEQRSKRPVRSAAAETVLLG